MAKNFSKYLGKIALMTAAVLWAGCNDSEKKAETSVGQNMRNAERPMATVKVYDDPKPVGRILEKEESSVDENASAESSDSDSIAVIEQPKDSLLKRAARIAKVKSEIGMIRALYGVIEEDMGRAVALYGVRPPREIIMPDGPREIHQPRPVARCYVKELIEQDVVVGEGGDIDVQTLLKVFRQRSPGIRHICNKNLYTNLKYRAKRTKEFEGTIVFEVKIAPSGEVENIEIKSSTVRFSEEIRKSITRWVFPKSQKGGTFIFPVNLYELFPSSSSSTSEQPLSPTEN
ncbi:MAG: hypothetical protein J6W51_05215 [Fibrobacter sp.]|nr:hypothetical protein [Fibrobacter sp.]